MRRERIEYFKNNRLHDKPVLYRRYDSGNIGGDRMKDTNIIDTEELQSCIVEGFTSESTIEFYDISKEEYYKTVNSKKNITTKIGKNSQ